VRLQFDGFSGGFPVRAMSGGMESKPVVSEAPAATPESNLSPAGTAIFGPPTDYVGSPGTLPFLSFSGSVTSNIDQDDFYYVPLEEGVAYEIIVVGLGPQPNSPPSISVTGIGINGGTGVETALGNYFNGVVGTNTPLTIIVDDRFPSDYVIYVNRLLDEAAADTTTTATVAPGSTVYGRLDSPSDQDWFRADLLADRTYLLTAAAFVPTGGVVGAPANFRISVYSATGEFVGTIDDGWQAGTSYLFETAESGTFFFPWMRLESQAISI
jgi:hypothetical protein